MDYITSLRVQAAIGTRRSIEAAYDAEEAGPLTHTGRRLRRPWTVEQWAFAQAELGRLLAGMDDEERWQYLAWFRRD